MIAIRGADGQHLMKLVIRSIRNVLRSPIRLILVSISMILPREKEAISAEIRHPKSEILLLSYLRRALHALQPGFDGRQRLVKLALLDGLVKNVPALPAEVRGKVLAEGFGQ